MTTTTARPAVAAVSEDDLRGAVEELLDEIVNGDDTCWQRFAEQMAAETAAGFKMGLFKTWSSTNRLYLAAQVRRRGQRVHGLFAGVDQWRRRNRSIRPGEEPYIIFGPPTYFVRQQQAAPAQANQPATPAQGQQAQQGQQNQQAQQVQPARVLRFRRPPAIAVYDYTQTVSDDPDFVEPDWAVPLAGGDITTLETLAATSPVPVRFVDIGAKLEHGWLDKDGITVDASQTVAGQISALAHELAHHHLGHLEQIADTRGTDEADEVKARCEQEAALTQFFVMKILGLDESVGVAITAAAGQYLRTWLKVNDDGTTTPIAGHKGRRKLVKQRFDVAFRAAQQITSAYAQAVA